MLSIIACVSKANGAIGRAGDLIYHISADLRRFKALTTGGAVVMGRCTFESLPGGALPNRRNIVVTRRSAFSAPGVEVAHSLPEALTLAGNEAFIIGGESLYREAMPVADRLLLTEVDDLDAPPQADTYFPPVDPAIWQLTDLSEPATDPRSGLAYRFATYMRR